MRTSPADTCAAIGCRRVTAESPAVLSTSQATPVSEWGWLLPTFEMLLVKTED
jgi:hypothetical protein